MMIIHGINENILITQPSYSALYQDEKKYIYKYIYIYMGWNQTKTPRQNVGARFSVNIDIFKISH